MANMIILWAGYTFVFLWVSLLSPFCSCAQSLTDLPAESQRDELLLFQDLRSVYGASGYEQQATEAPSSVSIVTAEEIKKQGYRTLADILRGVRGFLTTYDRNYHYLGVRGFGLPGDYNTRILLLVDGHRINDNVYDQAPIGTDFILDIDLIERVEVIRGPSSSLYGSNAFFAVINVITRRGRELKGVEVSGEGGSYVSGKGRLSYGNRFPNSFEMLLSGSYYSSEGRDLYFKKFDKPKYNNGIAAGCDDDRFHSFFSKMAFRDFSFEAAYVNREKGIPTAPWDTVFNDPATRTFDERAFLDLKYDHNFLNQAGVMARVYYDRYLYDGHYMYDWADPKSPPHLVLERDYCRGERWGSEVQLTRTLFNSHKFIIGGEFIDNFRQDQGAYDVEVILNDKESSANWALYAQDEFRPLSNLIINAGVRYDFYETFGGIADPRLALIYSPFKKSAFKLLYGRAFRTPNAYELYYQDSITQKPSPDLKPEKIETYELVWEQYFGKGLRTSTSAFYYTIDNLISERTDPADGFIFFQNEGKISAKGIEFEIENQWSNGLEGLFSYSFQETRNSIWGNTLSNSPEHLAKFRMSLPLLKDRLFLGVEEQYTSKRKTLTSKYVNGFFLTNLTLFSRDLFKGLELSAGIYNLFDKAYGDPGAEEHREGIIRQDGRTFRVKITYLF